MSPPSFVVYVEGPQDRGVIEAWASSISGGFGREVARSAVILGGRRTERATAHFQRLRTRDPALRGLCILDRDDVPWSLPSVSSEAGLDVFTWPRRHIESYLLVPQAIRRSVRVARDDLRLERFFELELPDPGDEAAFLRFDAKHVLARNGALSAVLGTAIRPTRIARRMRHHELHRDVLEALHRIALGLAPRSPRAGAARRV